MSTKTTIQVTDEIDRWKWVCPRGHRQWEPTNRLFERDQLEDDHPQFRWGSPENWSGGDRNE